MITTTNVRFKKDTKQSIRNLSTTTTVEVQSTKKKSKNFQILYFVICTPLGRAHNVIHKRQIWSDFERIRGLRSLELSRLLLNS